MKIKISLYVIGLVFALKSASLANVDVHKVDPLVHDATAALCAGDVAKARELNGAVLASDSQNLNARLLQIGLTDSESIRRDLGIKFGAADAEKLSEADRVVAATGLIMIGFTDLERLKKLLAFSSIDAEMESYRLTLEAQLSFLLGRRPEGIALLLQAEKVAKNLDVHLLSLILSETHDTPDAKKIAARLRSSVERVPDDTPIKSTLRAYLILAESGWDRRSEVADLFKKSYEMCSGDPNISVGYAFLLYFDDDFAGVRRVLERTISLGIAYSPYVDYMMVAVNIFERNYDQAEAHLNAASRASAVFNDKERADLQRFRTMIPVKSQPANVRDSLLPVGIALLVVVLAICGWLIVGNRRR